MKNFSFNNALDRLIEIHGEQENSKKQLARLNFETAILQKYLKSGAVRWGTSEPCNDGFHYIFVVFPVTLNDTTIQNAMYDLGYDLNEYYGGVGRNCHGKAQIRRSKTRAIVTQYHYMDI